MKKLITISVLLCFLLAQAQNEVKTAEYFYDSDPGVGNGNAITLNANTGSLNQKLTIPTTTLSAGFHSLHIRSRDAQNQWGLYDRAIFYKGIFDTSNTIAAAEYYFDTIDPGVGSATLLAVNTNTASLVQQFMIPITSLDTGFHSIHIRTKDGGGQWSLYERRTFYLNNFAARPDIVAAEYFVDSDPGVGNGLPLNFTESGDTQMVNAPIESFNLADGEHIFYIRVQNSQGVWSIYDTQAFNVEGALGLEESILKQVSIFPNPFKNHLNIKSSGFKIDKLILYDNLGRKVFSSLENREVYELSNLQSGIYILNLQTDKGSASYRIIKN
ncbi:T9SS type A sorting domain-containing protein [Mariniflexile sp. AS56]|uniref:T9SS type A sorting domain-containing protein n=1 Tax=Mariniflexile sp. AS56 TaxID=3063957 RepID=UPI0026EA7ADB|nr:T9SS type A sorting domain-containing protein [Mariniflexile sp. AS56]MDO7173869.1 T9SS type A sorting domain-containing protein [Mariniflexile sp. AS56]